MAEVDRQLRGGRGGDCGTSPTASQLGGEGGDGSLPAGGGPIDVGGVRGGAGGHMGGVPQSDPDPLLRPGMRTYSFEEFMGPHVLSAVGQLRVGGRKGKG